MGGNLGTAWKSFKRNKDTSWDSFTQNIIPSCIQHIPKLGRRSKSKGFTFLFARPFIEIRILNVATKDFDG